MSRTSQAAYLHAVMQIVDITHLDDSSTTVACGICIIGAGAAGLYLAHRLAERGENVAVVEAGGASCVDTAAAGFLPAPGSDQYGGAGKGRAFGLGGTTSLWGGQLLPYNRFDLRADSEASHSVWPLIVSTVGRYAPAVYSVLDVFEPADPIDSPPHRVDAGLDSFRSANLMALTAEWLPFRRRNFRGLIKAMRSFKGSARIFLRATAAAWSLAPRPAGGARVVSLIAKAPNGREIAVCARHFVLAAGAVETTRILLEISGDSGNGAMPASPSLGRFLSDHLSCRIATVPAALRSDVVAQFGPRFAHGRMRTFRLVESDLSDEQNRRFYHFEFDHGSPGLVLVRKLLQSLQARQWPKISGSELLGAAGIVRIAYARGMRNRLHVNSAMPIYLRMDFEQSAHADNRIGLSEQTDALGRRMASIHWRVHDNDISRMRGAAARFGRKWAAVARYPLAMSGLKDDFEIGKILDTYHPVGTCRVGEDRESVLTPDLRVRGIENLSVLSTAMFPSAGTANPTFSLLCFGEALAEHLATGRLNPSIA